VVASIRAQGGSGDSGGSERVPMSWLTKFARSSVAGSDILGIIGLARAQCSWITEGDFDNLIDTNLRAPFSMVQQLVPALGQGSSVVLISSSGARSVVGRPNLDRPSILAYAATKRCRRDAQKHPRRLSIGDS
jgi:3-oxoacyl-[acyl-carrier protein] reductase